MKILVTGGGGFLGSAIVRELRHSGYDVVSFSRSDHPALKNMGVPHICGDISDYYSLKESMKGCEAVFHVAAKTGVEGNYKEFHRANVTGTENVLRACRECNIRYLVFTSSPSVVFDGKDSEGKNESLPYARKYTAAYPKTKAIAERMVMNANSASLKTVSLRPHLIWGPGDPYYLPQLRERAKKGKLFILGRSPKLVDCIYIDNAARAHLLAFAQLLRNPGQLEGKAYFISQAEPVPVSELMNKLLATCGIPPVNAHLSPVMVRFAGKMLDMIYRVFSIRSAPPVSYFLAQQLSSSHWYDISAAKRDFGYLPEITLDEGMERLRKWFVQSGE